jgi:hypothetical protein
VLFSWWRWEFSPGRFFTRSTAGGICIITVQGRRQNITGNRRFSRAIEHWRKPAACHPFATNNSLRPRFDLKRIIRVSHHLTSTRRGRFNQLLKGACFSGENDF